jgi:hypothetical protein
MGELEPHESAACSFVSSGLATPTSRIHRMDLWADVEGIASAPDSCYRTLEEPL